MVTVNGEAVDGVVSGDYLSLNRRWQTGDSVAIGFDMPTRAVSLHGMTALTRGPILLARDTRFGDGYVDECVTIATTADGTVSVTPVEAPEGMWMAFTTKMVCGTYADGTLDRRTVHLCDFASAGNTWDEKTRYRVWLPRLYVPSERTHPLPSIVF